MAANNKNTHVIVYQFGKVASTAVVQSFDRLRHVSAVQSHFLGEYHLKRMVDNLANPITGSHFFEHGIGQFRENLITTRDLNAFRRGLRKPDKLVIISAVRDPLDWNRSRFAQDLEGYLPVLREHVGNKKLGLSGDGALIQAVLPRMFLDFNRAISAAGGIDNLFEGGEFRAEARKIVEAQLPTPGGRRLFFGMLTPFSWFDSHFCRVLNVQLDQFARIEPGLLWKDLGWADCYIYKYETVERSSKTIAARLGFDDFQVKTENVSSDKRLWEDIVKAFASTSGLRLGHRFRHTRYAQRFGYNPARQPLAKS